MKLSKPKAIALVILLVCIVGACGYSLWDYRAKEADEFTQETTRLNSDIADEVAGEGGFGNTNKSKRDGNGTIAQKGNDAFTLGEAGGYLAGEAASSAYVYLQRRFTDPTGFGFAAEEANNFIDRLKGLDAEVVGYDNAKNGADRKIINRDGSVTVIQDKYYQSADGSVNAAFEGGEYRYIKSDGKPMQLEVPADQYDDAVMLMQKKIEEGRVPTVSDPAEAESLVRKGSLTYKQAVNLTKAGNLTSLKYDATQGIVSAAPVAGITFALDFLVCTKDGMSVEDAVGESSKNAMISGSAVFAGHMLSSQLMKTGLSKAMAPTTENVAKWLGDDACRAIIKAAGGETAGLSSASLAKHAGKLLGSKLIFNVGFVAVLTVPDALDLYHGRMSQGQFVKNLAIVVVGIAGTEVGSVAGGALGTYFAPGIGTKAGIILGGIAGGMLGATAADLIGDKIFKDDADQMYEIVSNKFSEYCFDYVAGEKEAEELATELNNKLSEDGLKDMFKAEDRGAYADELIKPLFENMARNRAFKNFPETDYQIRTAMLSGLDGIVFIH